MRQSTGTAAVDRHTRTPPACFYQSPRPLQAHSCESAVTMSRNHLAGRCRRSWLQLEPAVEVPQSALMETAGAAGGLHIPASVAAPAVLPGFISNAVARRTFSVWLWEGTSGCTERYTHFILLRGQRASADTTLAT